VFYKDTNEMYRMDEPWRVSCLLCRSKREWPSWTVVDSGPDSVFVPSHAPSFRCPLSMGSPRVLPLL
jgi:hypothetical protein